MELDDKQLAEILRESSLISAQQLERAMEKQGRTGFTLRQILLPQVPWGRMRRMLENEATLPGGGTSRLGDVLADAGWITQGQLEEARREEEETGRATGQILLEQGVITREQLHEATRYHKRTGVSLWRTFINLDLALPKQVADALHIFNEFPFIYRGDNELPDLLVKKNLVSREEMNGFIAEREERGISLVKLIAGAEKVDAKGFAEAVAELFKLPVVDIAAQRFDDEVVAMIPAEVIVRLQALPFARDGRKVRVAMVDPTVLPTLERMGALVDMEFQPCVAAAADLAREIEARVKPSDTAAKDEYRSILLSAQAQVLGEVSGDTPISALTGAILTGGFHARATDIHLESQERGLRVRYRIDGLLCDVMNIPPSTGLGVISRLKVMSGLDIVERRRPQDGHLSYETDGRTLDMRIATVPGYLGEGVVIRIINEETVVQGLGQLGLEPQQRSVIDTLLARPYGMIMAAGPVGSGKTTTVYACINQVNVLERNVMTIEDPVEYRLKGTNQLQVDYRRGFDFATGLRSILRQDPDTIMVGEVRDEETAKIAVRAALTGVLVLTTLHGNDAPSTISSLYQYDIPGFLISNAVIGVIAQRLVRRICPECRQEYHPGPEVYRQVGVEPEENKEVPLYRGQGCTRCFHTGYSGRAGVFEVMEVTPELKELIFRETTKEAIYRLAIEQGMQPLEESGRRKVLHGETTVEEFFRVIFV
jgi:type IV pilus assembly protein PilB